MKQIFRVNILDSYEGLEFGTLTPKSAASELVDNAISAGATIIKIIFIGDLKGNILEGAKLIIEDNGNGIPHDKFVEVLMPYNKNLNAGIHNEHGLGYKNAKVCLGSKLHKVKRENSKLDHFSLCSKVVNCSPYKVTEILKDSIDTQKSDEEFGYKSGTRLTISNLKFAVKKSDIIRYWSTHLGARYQNPLAQKSFTIDLIFQDNLGNIYESKNVDRCAPILHPGWSKNNTFASKEGLSWKAEVFAYYRPGEDNCNTKDAQFTDTTNPYYYGRNTVDFFYKNILLEQAQLSSLTNKAESTAERQLRGHNLYLAVYLGSGFSSTNTKNYIRKNDSFEELKQQITEWLKHEEILTVKPLTSEKDLADKYEARLKIELGANNISREKSGKFGKRTDLYIKSENKVIEMKRGPATTEDIMQSFHYAIEREASIVMVVAESFNNNVEECAAEYPKILFDAVRKCDKTGKIPEIRLVKLETLDLYK